MGQRLNIIIVAEGAIDKEGKAITPDLVKEVKFTEDKNNKIFHLQKLCCHTKRISDLCEKQTRAFFFTK